MKRKVLALCSSWIALLLRNSIRLFTTHELRERAAALCRTSATARSIKEQPHPTHYSVQPGFANVAQPSNMPGQNQGPILAMEKHRWEHSKIQGHTGINSASFHRNQATSNPQHNCSNTAPTTSPA